MCAHISLRERESSDSEGSTKVTQERKHSIYTHFPKDRTCDVCLRNEITKIPYEGSIPREQKFGDLITSDRKVLNEESGSRTNHRYAVVVQDLATQWRQSYSCKTKTSQETEKSSREFPEPSQKPKVIFTDNFHGIWQILLGISMESWNIYTSSIRNKRNCRTSRIIAIWIG